MYSTHLDNFDNTRSGDILYRESSTSSISFGPPITLLAGNGINHCEYTTSTHQTYNPAIVIFAMLENLSPNAVAGVLATDPVTQPAYTNNPRSPILPATQITQPTAGLVNDSFNTTGSLLAKPNPFTTSTTVDFTLAKTGTYTVTLFDNNGMKVKELKQGWSEAGVRNSINVDGTLLASGFYFITIKSEQKTQTFKLFKR
jgi:hypothetical protein